jgi:hypothetical protein
VALLDPEDRYEGDYVAAPEIGKKIVYTIFGPVKLDWPEDPRISKEGTAAGYGQGMLALDKELEKQAQEKNIAQGKYNILWGEGMLPIPLKTTTGGNTGGGADDDSVDPPRPPKETQTRIPGTSSEFLSMPDISKAIDDEIKRLTLSIIEDGKDLMLSKTVNYKSINFIPEAEVQINPPQKRINFIRDQFNDIARAVQRNINKSKKAYTNVYNYGEYLDFFEVRYNRSDGRPVVTFKINLEDFNLSELSVVNLRRTG